MIAFLYYTEWYFIFPLYFKNYFQKRNGRYFLQAERLVSWYNKRKQGNQRFPGKENTEWIRKKTI